MENGNGPIMEKNYIARLKAEIAQVLEILKETSWTDVDGSFTKYVIDGLNQLDGAYFECGHQNIPLPQVKQARDDITKAITDAKIIPNICSVLTHLYKGNLELFVGHKYDGISSTATRILCNYGSSAQFANEVANCPGFLEFISELLRDSSEDYMYLQINTQKTKLADRIDVFIKIVCNISIFSTNIPRLRTLNFTAALEPYLKANDGGIINITIDILTRVKVGEVFETRGITSDDTSSSQSAAPNWQTVVEKLTGLILNELKDLYDIEWKEENGAYKTNILRSLRLLDKVYYTLETQNVPQEYVLRSRKDIANVLIDVNIIPKICGVLTDLHLHTLEITDNERNEMLSSDAQKTLLNYTYASDDFPAHVANSPGFLEFILAKLTSASEEYLQLDKQETKLKERIDVFITIVGNISNYPTNIPRLRTLNFTAALEPYLKANDSDVLDTTINILTKVKIDEVIETIGVTTINDPSSSISVPNWQLVVEKVTGIISNELKDLHDIEWKEENGAYKTNILRSVRLIDKVYYALEARNVPQEYVLRSRKDIANVLIDVNIIPKLCGVLTDIHLHTLEINDNERNEMLSSDAQRILLNYVYASDDFPAHVANSPGFLEFILAKLTSASEEYLQLDKKETQLKDLIDVFIKIVGNISNSPTNIPRLRTLNFTAALVPYLKANDADILGTTIDILTWIKIGEVFETNGVTSEDASSPQIAAHNWQKVVEKDALTGGALHAYICMVYNIAMSDSCRARLRSIGTIDVFKPYLKSTDSDIQLEALATLAAITNEHESEIIKSNEQSVIVLMDTLRQGLKSVIRRSTLGKSRWSCEECALTIKTLARNDANKKLLVQLGAIDLLVELTEGDEDEQTEAVGALWALSFDEDNRKNMVNYECLELISVLDKMKASENKLIREAAYGTLWNLRDLLQNSKFERFRDIAKTMMTARERSLPHVVREVKREGHIMVSYQWSHQKTLLMIKEELVKKRFKVWMDVELMMGSIAQATAEAVENADIVLICMSNKYKNSKSCRREVEYADRLDKMIVPLQLEKGYRPDGWLGLIAGGLKSYDFSGHRPIKSELNGLLLALREMKDEFQSDPKENTTQYAERSRIETPLSPMEIDNSRAGNADSASLASIKSSSDDADTIENAVETVDITAGPITQEHINQARLCNVINTVCADVLRDILLSQFTNFYKSLLKSQTTIARMPRIGQAQLQLIFPDPHCRYTGTVDQFDITLLYALIRNISPCPAPVTGWGKPPTDQPRDVSLSANVERIRLLRNKVSGHSVDGKLDDQACEDYFGEIGELLNDVEAVLGDKGYKGALKERQTQIITPKEAKVLRAQFESYRNQLKEDMRDVVVTHESVKEAMEALEAKVEKLSTTIAQNL